MSIVFCPKCKLQRNTLDTMTTHQCYTCFYVWDKTGANDFMSIFGKVPRDFKF